jgi:hypothetical protein
MYQLPGLAKASCADKLRAAKHHQLCAQADAARRDGARRGIARLAGLRLRLVPASLRRAARAV